jgi:hypothetical protein
MGSFINFLQRVARLTSLFAKFIYLSGKLTCMRRVFTLLAFLLLPFSVFSETSFIDSVKPSENKDRTNFFIDLGASAGWFAVRDLETSPLIYRGFMPGIQFGTYIYNNKFLAEVNYNLSYGYLSTRNYPLYNDNQALAINNYVNLIMAWRLHAKRLSKAKFYLGSDINFTGNFRNNDKFNNASLNYEAFASLGPILCAEKEIALQPHQFNLGLFRYPFQERTIKFSTSLSVPLIAGVIRPAYATIDDFVNGQSDQYNLGAMKFVSFNRFFNIMARLQLYYYLHNFNMFKFSYSWYYYSYYPESNKVSGVNGYFSFAFLFMLNNR